MELYNEDLVLRIDHDRQVVCIGTVERRTGPATAPTVSTVPPPVASLNELMIDDESEVDDELYDAPQSTEGDVMVRWWLNGRGVARSGMEAVTGSSLVLYERGCMLSDLVKHRESGRVGTVTGLGIHCHMEIVGADKLIMGVNAADLRPEMLFMEDLRMDYVVYKSWLGRVTDTGTDILVRFPDGALLRVEESLLEDFVDSHRSVWSDHLVEGCVLKGSAHDLRSRDSRFLVETPGHNAKWLRNLRGRQMVQVVVQQILVGHVTVEWLANRSSESDVQPATVLIEESEVSQLKPINPYPWHSCVHGDVWYYQLKENDVLLCKDKDEVLESALYHLYTQPEDHTLTKYTVPPRSSHRTDEIPAPTSVEGTASASCDLPFGGRVIPPGTGNRRRVLFSNPSKRRRGTGQSTASIVSERRDRHHSGTSGAVKEPEEMETDGEWMSMTEKTEDDVKPPPAVSNIAGDSILPLEAGDWVPVGIIATQSLLEVTWQDGTIEKDIPSTQLIPQLFVIDEHDFFPGDFVTAKEDTTSGAHFKYGAILNANTKDRVCTVQWFDVSSQSPSEVVKLGEPEEVGVYDIVSHTEHKFRLGEIALVSSDNDVKKGMSAGFVIQFKPEDGQLLLRWPDATETSLYPTQLLMALDALLSDGYDSDSSSSDPSFTSEDEEWETENEEEIVEKDEEYKKKIDLSATFLIKALSLVRLLQSRYPSLSSLEAEVMNPSLPPPSPYKRNLSQVLTQIKERLATAYEHAQDERILDEMESWKPKEIICAREFSLVDKTSRIQACDLERQNSITSDFRPSEGEMDTNGTQPHVSPQIHLLLTKVNSRLSQLLSHLDSFIVNWVSENGLPLPTILKASSSTTDIDIDDVDDTSQCLSQPATFSSPPPPPANQTINGDAEQPQVIDSTQPIETGLLNQSQDANTSLHQSQPTENPLLHQSQGDESFSKSTKPLLTPLRCVSSEASANSLKSPLIDEIPTGQRGHFLSMDEAPTSHKLYTSGKPAKCSPVFMKAWRRDTKLLSTSLPQGVTVKSFDNRMDLFSLMIEGPSGTPYQYALFFFDMHLPPDYPSDPPKVFYLSQAPERVNPNLYVEGKVCLSLLGTWMGKGSENWNFKTSNLLQVIVSLQGLILTSEPYYNEAGFEGRRGTEDGRENSKKYNESAIISTSQSMARIIARPIEVFRTEIFQHFTAHGTKYIELLRFWQTLVSQEAVDSVVDSRQLPEFPLVPTTKGFQIALKRNIVELEGVLTSALNTSQSSNCQL